MRKLSFQARGVGQRAKECRIDQRIDDMRMLRQNIRKPRRHAEDESDKANKLRILPQQRQQAASRTQTREKPVE